MKSKKRPLNFAAPSFAEDPPAFAYRDDVFSLDMPPVPGDFGKPASTTPPRGVAPPAPSAVALRDAEVKGGGGVYILALVATLLWLGGVTAFTLGYRAHVGPFEDERFTLIVLGLLALAPVGLVWICAFALHQGGLLIHEIDRLQRLTDQVLAPTALAVADTGSAVQLIRLEVQSASEAAEHARNELLRLRDALADESARLLEMATGSARDASGLVQSLGNERVEFGLLSNQLEARVSEIGEAVSRHARMVAEASDLAQVQIQEAEAALAARAADLAAAAGEAAEAARLAGDDLARQAARLEQAGVTVGEQVQLVEEGLGQQRAGLVTLAHSLRTEQEDLAVQFESQRAQLVETLRQSEQGALQVSEVAQRGAETLREMIAGAAQQLRDMGEQAQTERDLLGGAALQSLGAFSEAAAFERRALEEETRRALDELTAAAEAAHRAAEEASAAARIKVDQLSEAAFAAGQTADASFDKRLKEARGLIERSALLVDEAGLRSAQKLEQGVGAARAALETLERSLDEIAARAASLPGDIKAHGQEIRDAVELANQTLLAGARIAADELEAVDTAFQERVKRNYEMLSEAVRLMGVLGGGAAARAGGAPAAPARSNAPATPTPALPLRRPEAAAPAPPLAPPPPQPPLATPAQGAAEAPDAVGLRPRLKLTLPEAETPAPRAAPTPSPAAGDPDWTWNELVSALDENDADDTEMERVLIAEIEGLGIDAAALIPRRRLADLAQAYEQGDAAAARDIVHRLAPAAVRKLARLVLSDKLMRAQADRFIARYAGLIRGAARRSAEGLTTVNLLGSDAGRAYLLLDAAVGDLE
jgi:hypothetical protein